MSDLENETATGVIRRSWGTWAKVIVAGLAAALLLVLHALLAFNAFVRPVPFEPFGLTLVASVFVACTLAGLAALPSWNRWALLALPVAISADVVNQVFARMTTVPAWPRQVLWIGIGWYWVGPVLTVILVAAAAVTRWREGAVLVIVGPEGEEPEAASAEAEEPEAADESAAQAGQACEPPEQGEEAGESSAPANKETARAASERTPAPAPADDESDYFDIED